MNKGLGFYNNFTVILTDSDSIVYVLLKLSLNVWLDCHRDRGAALRLGGGGSPLVTQYWGRGHKTLFLANSL